LSLLKAGGGKLVQTTWPRQSRRGPTAWLCCICFCLSW